VADAHEYKNPFTLDGKIKTPMGVTRAKVKRVKELAEATMAGDRSAKGALEESVATSDAIFNLAYLFNLNVLPQFDLPARNWSTIAGTRLVSDFRNATLYSLVPEWNPGVLGDGTPNWVAPVIPEGAAYPYAYLEGEVSIQGGVRKRGFKTGFTFEAWINDSVGALQSLPEAMRQIGFDTEEFEVWNALISGVGAGQQLDGGTPPTGVVVPPNAPLGRDALIQAIIELTSREISGRKVRITGGYNLIVGSGQGVFAQFILDQTFAQLQDGSFLFNVNGYNPLAGITVVESEYVTAPAWYLVPKQGGTGGRPVLELLRLTGHELPELRVQGNTGSYVGSSGAVSPFEGNFENDTADFRMRIINRGILWTPDLVIWSNGTGS
jgi:hypothetical protein